MQPLHIFSFVNKTAKKLLLLILLFSAQHLHSQVTDSAYIGTLYQKGWDYLYTDPDSASWFFEKGKAESKNRKYFRGLITYYNYDAALQISLGQNQKALEHYEQAIVLAKNGDIYISDSRLHRIIKIANNKVTTVAGTGKFNFSGNPAGAAEPGYADGKALTARFDAPNGIAFDRNGNLFIIDRSNSNNSYIRKLSPDGMVTTFCKHEWNPKTSQYEEAN